MIEERQDTLLQRFAEALPPPLAEMVAVLRNAAASAGVGLYLVGGAVRDLLLGLPMTDVDLVVEGNAVALARQVASRMGVEVTAHPRFGTATLRKEDLRLDVASCRAESYPHPGALPVVRPGSLRDDLARRDFTINALALSLTDPQEDTLIDPFGGRNDLTQGLIRVLHPQSFQDDATRMLRAVRYEARLGFRLEVETEALVRRDRAMLSTISADRLRREFELLFREKKPEVALTRLGELSLLAQLHPGLSADPWLSLRFFLARDAATRPAITEAPPYYALMTYRREEGDVESFAQRFNLPAQKVRIMRHAQRLKSRLAELERDMPPFDWLRAPPARLARHLASFDPEAVLAVALAVPEPPLARRLLFYLTALRQRRPTLTGDDLIALGMAAGPNLGRLKARLQDAVWDGLVHNREEEEALVRRWMATAGSD